MANPNIPQLTDGELSLLSSGSVSLQDIYNQRLTSGGGNVGYTFEDFTTTFSNNQSLSPNSLNPSANVSAIRNMPSVGPTWNYNLPATGSYIDPSTDLFSGISTPNTDINQTLANNTTEVSSNSDIRRLTPEELKAKGINAPILDRIEPISTDYSVKTSAPMTIDKEAVKPAAGTIEQTKGIPVTSLLGSPYEFDLYTSAGLLGQGIGNAASGNGSLENSIFGIAAPAIKTVASLGRTIGSAFTNAKMSNQIYAENFKRRQNLENDQFISFRDGGYFDGDRDYLGDTEMGISFATGEYAPTLDETKAGQANTVASGGEYVIQPDGSTQEIEGPKEKFNSKGQVLQGTPMDSQNGSAFISDALPVGKDFAKKLRTEYGINVKPTDSYASAADKYKSKIGLANAYKKQEEYFNKLEKNEKVKDENTRELNKQYLSGPINDLENEITPLESMFNEFSYVLFNEQEMEKENENTASFFKNGGRYFTDDHINKFASKHGMSMDDAKRVIYRNRGMLQSFQGGGLFFDTYDNTYRGQYNNQFGHQSSTGNGYGDVNLNTRAERLNEIARLFPRLKSGNSPVLIQGSDGNYQIAKGKTTKDMQRGIQSVYDSTKKLSERVGNKADFLAFFEQNGFVDEKGNVRDFDNMLGNFTSTRPAVRMRAVTEDQLKKLNDKGIYNLSEVVDNADAKTILGSDYDRVISYLGDGPDTDFYLAPYVAGDNNPDNSPVVEANPPANGTAATPATKKADTGATEPGEINKKNLEGLNQVGRGYQNFVMPDQYVAPPTPLQLRGMEQLDFTPVRPMVIDAPYQDIYGSTDQVLEGLDGLTDSQRAAIGANLGASAADSINKAYASVGPQNVQSQLQADMYNAQGQDNVDAANAKLRQSYETDTLEAMANTVEENRRYFKALSDANVGRFNAQTQMNLLSDLYENYNLDPYGQLSLTGVKNEFASNPNIWLQARANQVALREAQRTKKSTTTNNKK